MRVFTNRSGKHGSRSQLGAPSECRVGIRERSETTELAFANLCFVKTAARSWSFRRCHRHTAH
jgi:hypothetical protein